MLGLYTLYITIRWKPRDRGFNLNATCGVINYNSYMIIFLRKTNLSVEYKIVVGIKSLECSSYYTSSNISFISFRFFSACGQSEAICPMGTMATAS